MDGAHGCEIPHEHLRWKWTSQMGIDTPDWHPRWISVTQVDVVRTCEKVAARSHLKKYSSQLDARHKTQLPLKIRQLKAGAAETV